MSMFTVLVGASSVEAAPHDSVPSCSTIIPKAALIRAMGVNAVLRTVPMTGSIYSPWADGAGDLRGANITNTTCAYDWSYSTPGSLPTGDPDPDTTSTEFLAPNTFVFVGEHVTEQEWQYIKTNEAQDPGSDTDTCSGCAYAPQQPLSLGGGTQGFVESFAVPAPVTTPPSPDATCYMLYVLTRHHNLLEISAWPASLIKQKELVLVALGKYPTF
jgi:hypothetical protein